ncbi:MAG: hypothetical protein HYZ92_03755 [Candidatus Omnitrophica bacterium]|nr:hypothetical protein [Candidatus Omnitrophota bacterium]
MDSLKQLKDSGRLETIRIERAQVAKLVRGAYQDLKEAQVTFPVSDQAAYLFAYTAMLKIGRAFLFLMGYRPKGLGQHATVIEVADFLLGKGFSSLTDQFDRMRKKRNLLMYDVDILISHSEAAEAFKTAESYLDRVREFMEKQDPQLKFDFSS